MSKNRNAETSSSQQASETQFIPQAPETTPVNNVVPFYRLVPKNAPFTRVGYVIPGVPGCLVMNLSMFKDGVVPEGDLQLFVNGQPVALATPVVKVTDVAKAAAAALKAQEKLIKAQAKIEAQAVKAEERRVKAQAAADAALAKVAAATQA